MAEMQAVLVAMGVVHAGGRQAGKHAGRSGDGDGFIQALSAQIESGLLAQAPMDRLQPGQAVAAEPGGVSDAGDAIPFEVPATDVAGPAGDGSQTAAALAGQSLAAPQSQDQLMPILAMMWAAAPAQQAETGAGIVEEMAGAVQAGQQLLGNRAGGLPVEPSATRLIAAKAEAAPASLAGAGQILPSVDVGQAGMQAAPDDLPRGPSAELPASMVSVASQPVAPTQLEALNLSTLAVGQEPARDLLAQRVLEQMPRAAEVASLPAGIQAPLRSPAFSGEFGERLVWMASRHVQSAELTLNPPQLGAVEVRLSMNGSEAGAQFYSANPQVREILDQALPRLREIMAGAGITLGQASVSDQAFTRQDQPARDAKPVLAGNEEDARVIQGGVVSTSGAGRLGLVDLYA